MKKTESWHGSWSIQQRKFHCGLSHITEFLGILGILFFKVVKNEEIIVHPKNDHQIISPLIENESREDWNWIRGYHASNANPRKVGSHPHLYLITFTIISFNNALLEPISPSIPMYWIHMQTNGACIILLMTKYNNCFLVTQIYPIFIQYLFSAYPDLPFFFSKAQMANISLLWPRLQPGSPASPLMSLYQLSYQHMTKIL